MYERGKGKKVWRTEGGRGKLRTMRNEAKRGHRRWWKRE